MQTTCMHEWMHRNTHMVVSVISCASSVAYRQPPSPAIAFMSCSEGKWSFLEFNQQTVQLIFGKAPILARRAWLPSGQHCTYPRQAALSKLQTILEERHHLKSKLWSHRLGEHSPSLQVVVVQSHLVSVNGTKLVSTACEKKKGFSLCCHPCS